jgi:hypothetical protein
MKNIKNIKRRIASLALVAAMVASMFTFGAMTAAAVDPPMVLWDPITERFIAENNVMYAIIRGATPELRNTAIARARWMPLVGEFNVSRIIPRRPEQSAFIAFRGVDGALAGVTMGAGVTLTQPAIRTATGVMIVEISGRAPAPPRIGQAVADGQQGPITWDAATGRLAGLLDGASYAVMVGRAGTNTWAYLHSDDFSQAMFPMGAAIEVRPLGMGDDAVFMRFLSSSTTIAGGTNPPIVPGANPARVRVPAVPNAPAAPRIVNRAFAMRPNQQWVIVPNLDGFDMTTLATGTVEQAAGGTHWSPVIAAAGTVEIPAGVTSGYIVIRNTAVANRPASFPRAVAIPAS